MNGIVRRYDHKRGFGFIKPLIGKPDTTADVYFHASALMYGQGVPEGAEVRFDLVRSETGPQAANVELLGLGGKRLSPPAGTRSRFSRNTRKT